MEYRGEPRRCCVDIAEFFISITPTSPERYHHSSPTKPAMGWFHLSYPYWQSFELSGAK